VQQTASHLADRAGNVVTSQLTAQKDRAVQGLGSVADALRRTSQGIASNDAVGLHQYVDSAAAQIDRFSGYLRSNDLGDIVDDVEDVARRQPALFFGSAFVLGLLGARFLKSSRSARVHNQLPSGGAARGYGRQSYPPPTAAPHDRYAGQQPSSQQRPAMGSLAGARPQTQTPHVTTPGTSPNAGMNPNVGTNPNVGAQRPSTDIGNTPTAPFSGNREER